MTRTREKGATVQVHIVVQEDDKRQWKETAELLGISLSDYVRQSVRSSRIRFEVRPKIEIKGLAELIAQYGKIGSNINQIARHLNEGRDWSDTDCLEGMEDCRQTLMKVVDMINGDHQT